MKKAIFILLFFSINAIAIPANISVCFTPSENCAGEIVNEINSAQRTLFIQAYQFTSAPIASAVASAKRRGVDVRIILDKTQASEKRYSAAKFFSDSGIPVWIDRHVAIAHNKVMIIDNKEVITGSFNFTKAAQQRNAENLLIIKSVEVANLYQNNFYKRMGASSIY